MPKEKTGRPGRPAAPILLVLAIGCSSPDERLAEFAAESVDQQASQNREVSKAHREVAQGTKRLVEADARARQDLIGLEHRLHQERESLARQRDQLETERRELADQRALEPVIAAAVGSLGVLLAALLPLVPCWYLLHGLRHERHDEALGEMLAMELVSDLPVLLPPPAEHLDEDAGQLPPPLRGGDSVAD